MKKKRIRVLISAYACEPHKGSEPEVGWQWVTHLAEFCDVHVLTRENNRDNIESSLSGEERHLTFHYYALPLWARKFKKRFLKGNLGVSIYASLWHKFVGSYCNELMRDHEIDVFHHLTIASYRIPFIKLSRELGARVVIGPVGGCEDFPKRLMPEGVWKVRLKESLRNGVIWLTTRFRCLFNRYKRASLILASTEEMADCFRSLGFEDSRMYPTIGMNASELSREISKGSELKLLYVGNILYWKGLELAIRSLSKLPKSVSLSCYGSGPDLTQLEVLTSELGLSDRVFFMGKVPREELLKLYADYDVFFYPSLHDSGAFTVLEAMASGLPTVCLKRGGPGVSVLEECGYAVSDKGSKDEVIERLVSAVNTYRNDRGLISRHGEGAKQRIQDYYDWKVKAQQMLAYYEEVLEKKIER